MLKLRGSEGVLDPDRIASPLNSSVSVCEDRANARNSPFFRRVLLEHVQRLVGKLTGRSASTQSITNRPPSMSDATLHSRAPRKPTDSSKVNV